MTLSLRKNILLKKSFGPVADIFFFLTFSSEGTEKGCNYYLKKMKT